ncbi:MAG: pyrroloquinoline quinone biosynthesis protein PqqE [Rhodobacteraceae bacterium]|nr:pyrroloquinoline quinone biosynthesis protein PqqE [Paracoccaceae bacterium]
MTTPIPRPSAMLAELTHRCPLSCPYCSNPLELTKREEELTTEQWADVFQQAAALGVLHVHLSGGEPAARRDLDELTSHAVKAELYTNLITSGVGLTKAKLEDLAARGLDHVQLSIQGPNAEIADKVGGYKGGYNKKMQVAEWIAEEGLPLTVNAVMHRGNLDRLEEAIELAMRLGARRLEVATVQFHGWAVKNRGALMPTREQVERATATVASARERLKGELVIDYVPADYYARFPKPCMGGWGRIGLAITPSGKVMPCHAADSIPHLKFDNVKDRTLADIWAFGDAFTAYRGTEWMAEPCRSCDRREVDFGGCRCQAMAIIGDASATDPACEKSPHHGEMLKLAEDFVAQDDDFTYRPNA